MSIEAKINYQLNKYPAVKKVIKRAYQRTMYTLSPKLKSEGNIVRVSPDDNEHEYFFGYYDKSPWDATDRYMLCMQANNTWSDVSPREAAKIILIDTGADNKITILGETRSWNVQQGCMLQWLGPEYRDKVIFNDFRNGEYCSVILKLDIRESEISVTEEKVIPAPVYSVAASGAFALTLDFSRLYRLRPGYGYYNAPEKTANEKLPDKPCVWYVDLITGEVRPILKYTDFAGFEPRPEMSGAEHKVNHIMLSPDGKRFMILHRWFAGQRKYTRLITCNVDGSDMYNLSDDDMVSHCCWRTNIQILAFENKKRGGNGYYLMKDKTHKFIRFWPEIDYDGHPSYSPDGSMLVFDRYPDRARVAAIMVSDAANRRGSGVSVLARVFAPFKYDNDTRCDLHPRWNRTGNKICFDSVFEGHRGLYTVSVQKRPVKNTVLENQPVISVIVPVYNAEKYLDRCIESITHQTYRNLEIILADDGSSDKSGIMCDRYADTDNRITVIHKTNGGQSSARNAGLDIASGDYVAFVDSDDWIPLDIYHKCVRIIAKEQCEVVDYKPVYTDGKNIPKYNGSNNKPIIIYGDDILYDYLYRGQTEQCPFSACRKVYKRQLFDNVRFPDGRIHEEIATNFKILENAQSLAHIDDVGYFYFQNDSSTTHGSLRAQDFDLLDAGRELCALSAKYNDPRIKRLAELKLARSYFSLLAKAAVGGIDHNIRRRKACISSLTKNLRKNYALLMKSPISANRKLLITAMCINYRCVELPAKLYKKITAKKI